MFKNLKFYKSYEDIIHNTLVILLPQWVNTVLLVRRI